jgi:hypothetical protein
MKTTEVRRARHLRQLRHLDLLAYLIRRNPHADGGRLGRMSRDALLALALEG